MKDLSFKVPLRLGVLSSNGGSSLLAIMEAIQKKKLEATVKIVISNNSNSQALARARSYAIKAQHLSEQTHPGTLDETLVDTLQAAGVEWVILSGYLKKIGPALLAAFPQRILNIHPALLPEYGGEGMYGNNVHQAVLKDGKTYSGATIHLVNEAYDAGKIVAYMKVPVLPGDEMPQLQERVQTAEKILFPETLQRLASGTLILN